MNVSRERRVATSCALSGNLAHRTEAAAAWLLYAIFGLLPVDAASWLGSALGPITDQQAELEACSRHQHIVGSHGGDANVERDWFHKNPLSGGKAAKGGKAA